VSTDDDASAHPLAIAMAGKRDAKRVISVAAILRTIGSVPVLTTAF
jgi:hypothetical protein